MAFEVENAEAVGHSEKALLVEASDLGDDGVWIPQSQITDDSEVYKQGDTGTLIIAEWWARKQGWL